MSARGEAEGVFAVREGAAHFLPVRTGILGELHVEIVEGVEEGEQLVSGPYRTLRTLENGAGVEIEDPRAEAQSR
jgi:HlyD family secretion protein